MGRCGTGRAQLACGHTWSIPASNQLKLPGKRSKILRPLLLRDLPRETHTHTHTPPQTVPTTDQWPLPELSFAPTGLSLGTPPWKRPPFGWIAAELEP